MISRREFCGNIGALLLPRLQTIATRPAQQPVYAIFTCDNQWNPDALPVDSPATVEAMFEFLSKTHDVKRVYWRGEELRMWVENFQFRPEVPLFYDWFDHWARYLYEQVKVSDLAVAAAHRRGMEIYILDALLDHGYQAEASDGAGFYPSTQEDRLRIQHPEWCPVDRWGERRGAGPIEFCYPEARQALISRRLRHVTEYGYDGIFFYTYIECFNAKYRDEFAFNEPIVQEFHRRYGVDIRHQAFDKEAWYRLRGEYLTQFIRELHAALAAKGKKLSMAIYSPTPNYPEPWDGGQVDIPSGGLTYMDWDGWVREGIVDELFVWWRGDQKALLPKMLEVCKGKPVELTVAARQPFDAGWKPFLEAGVTPVSVWAPGFQVDRVTVEPSRAEALTNPDWRWRFQALADVMAGKLKTDSSTVGALASDPQVLVRRQAMFALGALKADAYVSVLEDGLTDKESSVRMAAAWALAEVNGPDTPRRIVAALLKDGYFQMKMACVGTLAAMKERALPALIEGVRDGSPAVREVCARALGALAPQCADDSGSLYRGCVKVAGENGLPGAQAALLSVLKNEKEDSVVFYALSGLGGYRTPEVITALLGSLRDGTPKAQMWAVQILNKTVASMSPQQLQDMRSALTPLFREFGDGSKRPDAAWGWRAVGNALCACGQAGKEILEAMRTQHQDRWLAWAAYQVLYVPQTANKAILCEEKEAVETHAKYAPPFPGWRV